MKALLFRMTLAVAISGTIIAGQLLVADGPAGVARKRALPPKWDDRVRDAFFTDARATLEGERPKFGVLRRIASNTGVAPNGTATPGGDSATPTVPGGATAWSKIVSADTLQDEIKKYQTEVKDNVKNPSEFKGNLFKRARDDFTVLAMAFGVIGEYDGDVRWKDQAVTARDLFGQSGVNCKVATDQSFNDAKLRADDLAALIRGDTLRQSRAPSRKRTGRRLPIVRR